jgi:hypothetical protein
MQGQRARRGRDGRSHATATTAAVAAVGEQVLVPLVVFRELSPLRRDGRTEEGVQLVGTGR